MFGAIVQYPAGNGAVYNYADFVTKGHEKGIKTTVVADIMSLVLLTPPGEWGADIVVGTTQRFGVPMGFGGPHAAFFATKDEYKRSIPGRIIGVTIDSAGNYALRMALQTREQHIRRDKATSNICTAQALLAIMAGMYAVYHGPKGVKLIAERIHGLAILLTQSLEALGFKQLNEAYFDTVKFDLGDLVNPIHSEALNNEVNLNYNGSVVTISVDETTSPDDIKTLVRLFAKVKGKTINDVDFDGLQANLTTVIPAGLQRTSAYLTHGIFNSHHSEHEMLRYIKSLETKDLSLCHSMIALGSCTMKLLPGPSLVACTLLLRPTRLAVTCNYSTS
jgi:glycine dehydrogenase